MEQKKYLALFDLDGTLTDSGEGIIKCATLALNHFGLPVPDMQTMRQFVGPPLHDTFVKFGVPADRTNEAIAVFRSRYIPIGKSCGKDDCKCSLNIGWVPHTNCTMYVNDGKCTDTLDLCPGIKKCQTVTHLNFNNQTGCIEYH